MDDLLNLILEELRKLAQEYVAILTFILPRLVGAVVILLLGWVVGRLLGKIAEVLVRFGKVDESISDTPVGKRLSSVNLQPSKLMNLVTRWAVYLFSIGISIRVLEIPEAIAVAQDLIGLVGRLVSGVLVLIIGVFVAEKIMDIATHLFGDGSPTTKLALDAARLVVLILVFIAALSQMRVDLTPLTTLVTAIAWGVGIGLGLTAVILAVAVSRDEIVSLLNRLYKSARGQG